MLFIPACLTRSCKEHAAFEIHSFIASCKAYLIISNLSRLTSFKWVPVPTMMTYRHQVPDKELPLKSSWQIPNLGIYFENAYPQDFLAWATPLNSSLPNEFLTKGCPWWVSHYDFLTTWLPKAKLPHNNKFLTTSCQQRVPDEFLTSSYCANDDLLEKYLTWPSYSF